MDSYIGAYQSLSLVGAAGSLLLVQSLQSLSVSQASSLGLTFAVSLCILESTLNLLWTLLFCVCLREPLRSLGISGFGGRVGHALYSI